MDNVPPRSLSIITGASRGLGASIAQQLAALADPSLGHAAHCPGGHDLLLLARDSQRLSSFCQGLQQALEAGHGSGGSSKDVRVLGRAVDLGDMQQVERALTHLVRTHEQGGWLPVPLECYASVLLVHNAGTCGDLVYSWQQTLRNIQREMELNVVGPAAMSAALLGALKESERCREVLVVSISSVTATQPHEGGSVYGAGKAARLALTRTLAREAELVHNPWAAAQRQQRAAAGSKGDGGGARAGGGGPPTIRTLSYAPGALDTDFQAMVREGLPADAPLKQGFISNHVNNKLLDPAVSAKALIGLLAGDKGPWENGQHLSVYELLASEASGAAPAQDVATPAAGAGTSGAAPQPAQKHPLDFGGISNLH